MRLRIDEWQTKCKLIYDLLTDVGARRQRYNQGNQTGSG